jgi:hypothetical protein
MDEAEADVLAYMTFPGQHRVKPHSMDEKRQGPPRKIML